MKKRGTKFINGGFLPFSSISLKGSKRFHQTLLLVVLKTYEIAFIMFAKGSQQKTLYLVMICICLNGD